jgi:hypothetical protein
VAVVVDGVFQTFPVLSITFISNHFELFVAEDLFAIPSVRAKKTTFSDAVVHASYIVGKQAGLGSCEPVMANKNGLFIGWVR